MSRKLLYGLFFLLFATDTAYSFYIHFHTPLGGDLAEIVVAKEGDDFYEVLQHPFGKLGEYYPGTNRFFAHWTTAKYFYHVPLFLQKWMSPIDSVYFASALAKSSVQLFIIVLLVGLIIGNFRLNLSFIALAAVLSPLFQSMGYNRTMGIIDKSVVYTFFYALPVCLLLLFIVLLIRTCKESKQDWNIKRFEHLFLLPLLPVICFNGPLIPGIILTGFPLLFMILLHSFKRKSTFREALKKIPRSFLFYGLVACLLSGYSLYIGSFNVKNVNEQTLSLMERFPKLIVGIGNLFSTKLSPLLLLLFTVFSWLFLKKRFNKSLHPTLNQILLFCGLFILCYTLLLPLGGYRIYRPNIIRYDTYIPVTLILIYLFGQSVYLLFLQKTTSRIRTVYTTILSILLFIHALADRVEKKDYACERTALHELSNAKDKIVSLRADCSVMEWNIFDRPEQSELNSRLFYHWNITDRKVLYFQKD